MPHSQSTGASRAETGIDECLRVSGGVRCALDRPRGTATPTPVTSTRVLAIWQEQDGGDAPAWALGGEVSPRAKGARLRPQRRRIRVPVARRLGAELRPGIEPERGKCAMRFRSMLTSPLVLVPVAVAVPTGLWVAFVNPDMLAYFLWMLTMLTGLFYFGPVGYRRGHPGQGVGAVLMTVLLGPIALLILVPWARFGRWRRDGSGTASAARCGPSPTSWRAAP